MKTKILIPLAGVALFCACKGGGPSADPSDADTVKKQAIVAESKKTDGTMPPAVPQKLVKTASMHFKVKNVEQTSNQIATLTANCAGTVMYHTINSVAGDSTTIRKTDDSLLKITVLNTSADMTVRIPTARVEAFVSQVAQMGVMVNSLRFEINDKTYDYLATRLKLKNQQDRAGNGQNGSAALKNPDNMLDFKNHIVDQQIGNLKTDDSVKNAVIALNFYESQVVRKELIANPDLAAYNLPLSARLANSLKNGWDVFVDILVEVANLWMILPIAGLVWVAAWYYSKRKRSAAGVK